MHLLPNGRRHGHFWLCGDIYGNSGDSLKVTLEGPQAGLWHDFAELNVSKLYGGDILGLWRATRNLEFKDALTEAGEWLRLPICLPQVRSAPSKPVKPLTPIQLPDLDKGNVSELTALRILRGLPTTAGMECLIERGQLGFCWINPYGGADRANIRAWVVTDPACYNAQVRRLDGQKLIIGENTTKAKTWPGSAAQWPVGVSTITSATQDIYFAEGGPDLLAAASGVWMENVRIDDSMAFVAMLGAGMPIHLQALPLFRGKNVKVFAHSDEAGRKAALKWGKQLRELAANLVCWSSDHDGEDLNDYIARHWASNDSPSVCWPEKLGL